jgi:hypothetical protein
MEISKLRPPWHDIRAVFHENRKINTYDVNIHTLLISRENRSLRQEGFEKSALNLWNSNA